MVGRFRPRATNGDEVALAEEIMQKIGGFDSDEAGRKRCRGRDLSARADHAQACRRAELCHLLANAAGPDNADRFIADYYGIVSLMIETAALFFSVAQVKTASEVEKAPQYVLGHGSPVREAARGGNQNIRAPKIGIDKVACSRGKLMHPFQALRACS